jgi:hypothetical protein
MHKTEPHHPAGSPKEPHQKQRGKLFKWVEENNSDKVKDFILNLKSSIYLEKTRRIRF